MKTPSPATIANLAAIAIGLAALAYLIAGLVTN